MELAKLKAFRQEAYNRLGAACDAAFELTDAVLLTRNAYSLADLNSMTPKLGVRLMRAWKWMTRS
jgi:hypothetical protein